MVYFFHDSSLDILFKVNLDKNIRKNIELNSNSEQLDEVTIKGEKEDKNITANDIGVSKIDIKEIKMLPVLFGEQDIMKTIQLMPGIKLVKMVQLEGHIQLVSEPLPYTKDI